MAYTLEEKLQIDAITKKSIHVINFGDWLFLTNGYYGTYVRRDKLSINFYPLKMDENKEIAPDYVEENFKPAKITKEARILANNMIVVKVKEKDGKEYAWAKLDYLKAFGNNVEVKISGKTKPIAVYSLGILRGLIMPVRIDEEEIVEMKCKECKVMREEHGYLWCRLHARQVAEEDYCSWGTGSQEKADEELEVEIEDI